MVKIYDEADRQLARNLYLIKGWGYLIISKIIGCSTYTIRKWIIDSGIEPRKVSGHSDEIKATAIKYYVEHPDLSMKKIAVAHHVCPATLSRWLHSAKIPVRAQRPRAIDRDGIIKDLESGMEKSKIAERNNCSERWVYKVQIGEG